MPEPGFTPSQSAACSLCGRSDEHVHEQGELVTQTDSEIVFDMVERLVARGYRVRVSIELPSGGGLTLTGEPDG